MIKRLFVSLLILFLTSNTLLAKSPPPGTGSGNIPANILIMLDNSGSMGWDLNGYQLSSNTDFLNKM